MARQIGTLAEKSLHAALKAHYSQEGDRLECALDSYVIDILRGNQCIEIQTRHLVAMRKKLTALLDRYPIHVIHPIAQERMIVRVDSDGAIVSRRKSPQRGTVYHLFPELVSLPKLIVHPNLTLEALLIREEQIWLDDGQGSWRRKHWSIADRRLLAIVRGQVFCGANDFAALIPADLPSEFDSGELAKAIHEQRHIAQKMAYCLREMGVLRISGKRGKALLYQVNRPIA
ncbi:MAG TPA: hypothetical protein VHD90_19785 [Phototrophicaceae bacterium]|nr:hypothetical protein [Phototrophicaceae bacterium]